MSIWSRFFGKDPKELFLAYHPQDSSWRIVSWNFDLKNTNERQWVIETHHPHKNVIIWHLDDMETVQFFEDEKIIRRRRITPLQSDLKDLMNLSIHSTLKFGLEENHAFMLDPVTGATTLDFQSEARALQWIQASFGTIIRALESFKKDSSLILTAAVFSGIIPESGERALRVLAFNLDIFFYLRSDKSLQIVIFDDKNMGHGHSRAPVYQQIIKVTKPQFYDEIVKLVHLIANVGEIK
jgi:hypothetical protein